MRRQNAYCAKAQAVAALLTASIALAPALACGYHNQADMARGAMNLAFPKSLYVRTAVWQAQLSGVLPRRRAKPAKDLFSYQRTASRLREMGGLLCPSPDKQMAFTVALLDSMLWTRFVSGPEGIVASVYVKGPEKGDAVLVTESEVIRAFVESRLDAKSAERHGLFSLYGPAHRQAELRSTLAGFPALTRAQQDPLKGAC